MILMTFEDVPRYVLRSARRLHCRLDIETKSNVH
ncbi:hypothetical protein BCEP27_110011 [Burkholderia cepacia]